MRIALGADHRGASVSQVLGEKLRREGHEIVLSEGCDGSVCDYPERAWVVGRAVAEGKAEVGILICGTGVGMSIAANKVKGVRAAVEQCLIDVVGHLVDGADVDGVDVHVGGRRDVRRDQQRRGAGPDPFAQRVETVWRFCRQRN